MVRTVHCGIVSTLFPDATRPNFSIFVERSMAALARQPGIDLTIIAPVGIPPWPLSLHPRYRPLRALPETEQWHGLTVHRPRFTLIPRMAGRNAGAVARAVMPVASALAAEGQLDVLQAQFFWPDGPATQWVASALNIPYSVKARGSDISLWAQRPAIAPHIISAAMGADGVLAVANSLRDDIVALGIPAERIGVHHTGIDPDRFRPLDRDTARARWTIAAGQQMVLSVGALTRRKGQSLVLEAMRALPDNILYCIAGGGEDAALLTRLAAAAGLTERVRMLGTVAHDDLPSLYAAADVMALASESEGLANVWVEALACGVPLVLTDIPPSHDAVIGPDCGRVVARDPAAIATGIAAVLASPADRATLSAQTHARFDWQRHGAELADHLRAIASI